ncbi:MAG: cytochrome c maturation protein CcmE [Bacillota bacterium]
MKNKWIFGLLIIVGFAGYAFYSFSTALSPYVTFIEAAESSGRVQVLGYFIDDSSISFDIETGGLQFSLVDEDGTEAMVSYDGVKPDNFEHAENVVVVGQYKDGIFWADDLLVKCPSKYEEAGDKD